MRQILEKRDLVYIFLVYCASARLWKVGSCRVEYSEMFRGQLSSFGERTGLEENKARFVGPERWKMGF